MAAIFCLVCPYVGKSEAFYFQEVLSYLRNAVGVINSLDNEHLLRLVGVMRLMIHYHVVNKPLNQAWVDHVWAFNAIQNRIWPGAGGLSLRIFFESILAFPPLRPSLPECDLAIDSLLELDDPQVIRDCGCSPQALHLLGQISIVLAEESARKVEMGHALLARCDDLIQITAVTGDKGECIKRTAESYVDMARLLITWRLLEGDQRSSRVENAGNLLACHVLAIPVEGELFSAQYPLASAFWAIMFSPIHGQECYERLSGLGRRWKDRPTVG
jgi:hypothetical protein